MVSPKHVIGEYASDISAAWGVDDFNVRVGINSGKTAVGLVGAAERQLVALRRAQFEQRSARLAALSPLQVLERGYAVVFDAGGNVVKNAQQLAPGDAVRARFARGEVEAEVKKTRS